MVTATEYFKRFAKKKLGRDVEQPGYGFQGIKSSHKTETASLVRGRKEGRPYTLVRINREKWGRLTTEQKKGVLRHEALHLVSPRHDARFRAYASATKTPVTLSESFGVKAKVQGRTERGYETIKEFNSREDAWKFAKILSKTERAKRFKKIRVLG